jgi:hypothetical protein
MRIFIVFMLLALAGCTTTESLEQFSAKINTADGINRDEAALIAKQWLVDSKYEGDFQVIAPVVTGYEHYWQVTFLYKSLDYYEKVLDVFVDTLNGEVKGTDIRTKGTPPVTKEPWDTFNNNISIPSTTP